MDRRVVNHVQGMCDVLNIDAESLAKYGCPQTGGVQGTEFRTFLKGFSR